MRKTPHPFGHGAGYWWPTRPTSSASSTLIGAREIRALTLRPTLRSNGLKCCKFFLGPFKGAWPATKRSLFGWARLGRPRSSPDPATSAQSVRRFLVVTSDKSPVEENSCSTAASETAATVSLLSESFVDPPAGVSAMSPAARKA
jgi:hypothetical protein